LTSIRRVEYTMSMTQTLNLRPVGMSDEQTECDKCGRMELRGTVILADDNGEVGRYGTTCAGRLLGRSITRKDAATIEAVRRQHVVADLRMGLRAAQVGDKAEALWRVREARQTGIVRADEKAMIEKIETLAA
jgi:hypothetical protein